MTPTPARTKTEVVADFRRTQLLDAARASFARHGVSGTTVEQIAQKARVAKGTVYLYFRSKDDILWQALAEDLARLRADTVPVITAAQPLRQRLEAFLHGAVACFDRHRAFIELCHYEMTPDMRRRAKQEMSQIHAAQAHAWTTALVDAAHAGEAVAHDDPASAALAIVSLAKGLSLQRLGGWTGDPAAGLRGAVDILWKGIGKS